MASKLKLAAKILISILTVVCLFCIYLNSMQNGTSSARFSKAVLEFLKLHYEEFFRDWTIYMVRKAAHIAEYLLLGLLMSLNFLMWFGRKASVFWALLFLSLAAAVSDEFLQGFIEGRASAVADIMYDFGGSLAGIIIGVFMVWLVRFLNTRIYRRVQIRKIKLSE